MDAAWAAISAISSGASAIIVIAATSYAYLQLKEARRVRAAQILLQYQDWFLSEPYKSTRQRLFRGEFSEPDSLRKEDAARLEDVVDQLEFLRMLVDQELLDYEVVAVFYRYSPPRIWTLASPFILKMRAEAHGYGRYLEELARRYR